MRTIGVAFAGIIFVLLAEQFSGWDVLVNNYFYNSATRSWLISYEEHLRLSPIFYAGMKVLVSLVGTAAAVMCLASFKYQPLQPYRAGLALLVLCTMLIPGLVAWLKDITHMYCPNQLAIYSGLAPYVHLFEPYPADFSSVHPGRCFPAGHPSGPFALMGLSLVFQSSRNKRRGFLFGAGLGIIASAYQMLRGEHFLSHCILSFLIAVVVIRTLDLLQEPLAQSLRRLNIRKYIRFGAKGECPMAAE